MIDELECFLYEVETRDVPGGYGWDCSPEHRAALIAATERLLDCIKNAECEAAANILARGPRVAQLNPAPDLGRSLWLDGLLGFAEEPHAK